MSSVGWRLQCFQALSFATVVSEHSGVHHPGLEGEVVSFLEGMNWVMASRMVCEIFIQHCSGQSLVMAVQSIRQKWARIRSQSA